MRSESSRRTLGMCGRVGAGDGARLDAMSELLGGVRSMIDEPAGALRADAGAVRWTSPVLRAVSWSPTPLPGELPTDILEVAERFDAFSIVVTDGSARSHSGISGAVPVYADTNPDAGDGMHFCSRLDPLVRTRPGVRPDWHAWAHILAAGAPLDGRTTFDGIRRLQPWSSISAENGKGATLTTAGWPWLEAESSPLASSRELGDALLAALTRVGSSAPLASLLSGGWDSRLLATLAARVAREAPGTWTTSSDTATVMEELVAAKVAGHLGLPHHVVAPRWDEFGADLEHFAAAVDYQTSFHVWLVPLVRALAGTPATVLDGLGGGLFVGGAFPDDDTDRPVLDKRFDQLARYLPGAAEILHPHVVAQIRDRTRDSFETVAEPLTDHPFGATFTAYLTRTLPGISLAPYGLVAASAPVATPFLDNDVVQAALAIPPEQHAGGQLYPELLRTFDTYLAELPTAADLTPRPRRHPRRVSSAAAADVLRELVLREPVRRLLAPGMASADLETWRQLLDQTRAQHVLRGLAMLSLWLQRYQDVLDGSGVDELLELP